MEQVQQPCDNCGGTGKVYATKNEREAGVSASCRFFVACRGRSCVFVAVGVGDDADVIEAEFHGEMSESKITFSFLGIMLLQDNINTAG